MLERCRRGKRLPGSTQGANTARTGPLRFLDPYNHSSQNTDKRQRMMVPNVGRDHADRGSCFRIGRLIFQRECVITSSVLM